MDWNWFFSSLAQSVAALVGVLAAFMIARLLNSQAEFSRNRARTEELLISAERLQDAAKIRYFDWYNDRTNKAALERVVSDIRGKSAVSRQQHYEKGSFSIYTPRAEVLQMIDDAIAQAEQLKRLRAEKEERERRKSYGGLYVPQMPEIEPLSSIMAGTANRQELTEEAEDIERLGVEVRHHIRQVSAHLEAITGNPERSPVLTATLVACALLFYTGIIYPLSFLPAAGDGKLDLSVLAFFTILFSLRGILLALVAVVFSILLAILYRTNAALTHDARKIEMLKAATSLGWYSTFFEVAEANRVARAGAAVGGEAKS